MTIQASSVRVRGFGIGSMRQVIGGSGRVYCMRVQYTHGQALARTSAILQDVADAKAGDHQAVHWQSAFGLIIIETRGGQVFVNGDLVQPASETEPKGSA